MRIAGNRPCAPQFFRSLPQIADDQALMRPAHTILESDRHIAEADTIALFTHHASRISPQVSRNSFPKRNRPQPKQLIRRPCISKVAFLQHDELITVERRRSPQQVRIK